jgi:hypothetical protein
MYSFKIIPVKVEEQEYYCARYTSDIAEIEALIKNLWFVGCYLNTGQNPCLLSRSKIYKIQNIISRETLNITNDINIYESSAFDITSKTFRLIFLAGKIIMQTFYVYDGCTRASGIFEEITEFNIGSFAEILNCISTGNEPEIIAEHEINDDLYLVQSKNLFCIKYKTTKFYILDPYNKLLNKLYCLQYLIDNIINCSYDTNRGLLSGKPYVDAYYGLEIKLLLNDQEYIISTSKRYYGNSVLFAFEIIKHLNLTIPKSVPSSINTPSTD